MALWGALFPGQGSQYPGMGLELYQGSTAARHVFEEADRALGMPLTEIIFTGSAEDLLQTTVQQPAILTVSVAFWRAMQEKIGGDSRPSAALGLSLGEYAAYVAAGALSFSAAVRLVQIRARAMQEAVPSGQAGMLAVLKLETEVVEEICRSVQSAGYIAPA
ncbi:MAG: ACP S-malonyltransferase, partial [Firmicutes bacterium]|nr:ACP S-malonyltransferase [Bacillota bacterium]